MAINKISGNILADNLQRGANLAVQGNLLYIDVINTRIGIKNSLPTAALDVTGNILANNIFSSGILSTSGNVTGGNLLFGSGIVSGTGNVYAGNIITIGPITASGNITGGNLISAALVQGVTVSASGNLVGGNANITNCVSATTISSSGNITGGNLLTSGLVSVTGNVSSGNVITGNVYVGNIVLPTTGNINAGNVNINNVSNPVANSDVATKFYVDTLVPHTGNITFNDTTIGTAYANTNINLMPTGNGIVIISTTTGLAIPVGNTVQRPTTPQSGTIRLNNSLGLLEFYNGIGWTSLSSAGGVTVTNQTINPDGANASYTLNQTATSASVMVTINGVAQTPDIDYTVASTTITFNVIPIPTDIIQIRFLAGITSTDFITNATGNAIIQATSSGNIVLQASAGRNINVTGNISTTGNISGNALISTTAFQLAVYDNSTARDAAITSPTAGMMIFNSTNTKFQGYTGSIWVDLN